MNAGGKWVIAAAGNEAQAYGILLGEALDTTVTAPVGSVARAGSFKADQLIVTAWINATMLTSALRQAGVFLEGDLIVPTS